MTQQKTQAIACAVFPKIRSKYTFNPLALILCAFFTNAFLSVFISNKLSKRTGEQLYEKEKNSVATGLASEVQFIEEEDGLYLEITLDEAFDGMKNPLITSEMLGMPRITEERFETPDGSAIVIDTDMLGNERSENPTAGPIETLKAGKNRIKVWNR